MELERPRKMELLYTPRNELAKMMKENSVSVEDIMFLFEANKITVPEIRMNAPLLSDRLLGMMLKQWMATQKEKLSAARASTAGNDTEVRAHNPVDARDSGYSGTPQQVAA
ncbi:MAG: hypothetical protein ABI361_07695 [Nitrososphaera sp.]|jgi:hypothetical protein